MADALILGCGYTGLRLGRRLLDAGHRVTGTSRDPGRLDLLKDEGIRPLRIDVSSPDDVQKLEEERPDVCFYLVPPLGGGGDELEAVIRALRRAPLEAFVYGSSTGVYGDRDGDRVDETDVPDPDASTGRARLEAERTVLRCGWAWDCRPRIGRIGGIYGPGRTLRGAIESGRYHVVEGLDAWTNRVHVEDLAAGLGAIWRRGENGRVYNLVDDEPHRSADFARLVAELAGLELTTLTPGEARERYSDSRWARKAGSKRVSNRRLRQELGLELTYPSYREGVPAALREEGVEVEDGEEFEEG